MSVKVISPLKQGLKLSSSSPIAATISSVKVISPLKQGLKLKQGSNQLLSDWVKVISPLKQGLKQNYLRTIRE